MKWSFQNILVFAVVLAFIYALGYSNGLYEDRLVVEEPEYNHIVRSMRCRVMMDTNNNVKGIELNDSIYTLDTAITSNL